MMYDVAVIGGGPAGSSSALKLAEGGASVIVLEKREIPRYKTCGGGIVQKTKKLLSFDISPVVEREFRSASVTLLGRSIRFDVQGDAPLLSMTMRSSFDRLLLSEAEKAGARVCPGIAVRSLEVRRDHVEVCSGSGTIRCRLVIVADGANSVTARSAGWKDTRHLAPAVECELYLPDDEMCRFENTVRFDFDLAGAGYGWLFPKRDHLSAGFVYIRRKEKSLRGNMAAYLRFLGITRVRREERHGFVIPISPRRDGFARGRLLLAGDAAGFADPVTAEGISSAVLSGFLAARGVLESRLHEKRSGAMYEMLVKRHILPELSAARLFAGMLYGVPGLGTWAVKHHGDRLIRAVSGVFTGERSYRSLWSAPARMRLLKRYLLEGRE
jgi:geranylgeranyl reductase family protein